MPSLREKLLVVCGKLRQLPTKFDIRLYHVFIRVTTWPSANSDDVPGKGTAIVTETELVLDTNGTRPKVTVLTTKDIVASGGLYKDGDYLINFITPHYTVFGAGGVEIDLFEPDQNTVPTEILFSITGPEFPLGALFKKIETQTYRPFHFSLIVRKVGVSS